MALVSAAWIETDAYRYAGLLLFITGLFAFSLADPKPTANWMNLLCISWSVYVLVRIGFAYANYGGQRLGTSEGIYLFTAMYPTIGYALSRYPGSVKLGAWSFIAISFAVVLVTAPFSAMLDADRHDFLFTENTIHSSVGAGFIMFAALNFAGYVWRCDLATWARRLWLVAAYVIVVLCAVGLYGAKSKGVWFAVSVGLFAQLLMLRGGRVHVHGMAVGAVLLAAAAVTIGLARHTIWALLGPYVDATSWIIEESERSGSLSGAVEAAVASGRVPFSMSERLVLWANAVEAWSHNIVLGNGILWEKLFLQGHYKAVGYNLLHNGYLEVAVRYGLVGLAFYSLLFGWSVVQSHRAWKNGLVAREAFTFHFVSLVFFLGTILTNSNNRLAMGEAYMMAMTAFGFCCHFGMTNPLSAQRANQAVPR